MYKRRTFGGNPLALAVANAVLDFVFANGFMENVMTTGKKLHDGMTALSAKYPTLFDEARGIGMHLGLKCKDGIVNNDIVIKAIEKGMLIVPGGDNVIRMIPPLTITEVQLNEAMTIMEKTYGLLIAEGVSR